ncbi:M48 family metalloprotease [Methylophilaceae bacterium Uisw_097]|jgi:predicted Zn-dependent protease|tara:strand:- start:1156 stop:2577 length:1422 start_codon:yes stop_codon:yes gene_type:complete
MKKTLLIFIFLSFIVTANNLPELGDYSSSKISESDEIFIGRQILFQVNQSDSIIRDIEISDYLDSLGKRLINASTDPAKKIEFFIVSDPSINAFAMLGGVIGVHSGLFLASNTESELASVISHEIAHINQKHISRFLLQQERASYQSTFIMAVALLLARSNPQLASTAMAGASAGSVQGALDFTRENEKEADRVGIQTLNNAGFDVRGARDFFTTLKQANQFSGGAAPAFLQTHPITSNRINDIEDRLKDFPYKQRVDNQTFHYVKGKLKALLDNKEDTKNILEKNIKNKIYINEGGERFALAYIYLIDNEFIKSYEQMQWLFDNEQSNPMLSQLYINYLIKINKVTEAKKIYEQNLNFFPSNRSFIYGLADLYLETQDSEKAIKLLKENEQKFSQDPILYKLFAKGYANQGKKLLQYENLAEAAYYNFNLQEAIIRMDLAIKANDGDFYQKSRVESRLKQFQKEQQIHTNDN